MSALHVTVVTMAAAYKYVEAYILHTVIAASPKVSCSIHRLRTIEDPATAGCALDIINGQSHSHTWSQTSQQKCKSNSVAPA